MATSPQPLMNAIVLHAIGDLRYQQVAVPIPREHEVRVRVKYCGVCGSDLPRCYQKGTYNFPTICGHEFCGVVEQCGAAVTKFRVGDPVVVFPLLWKDDHPACEQGKYCQSEGYDYLGSRSHGGFAEYVAAPERNLIRIPEGVSFEEAAMTEPAAVALHAVRRARAQLGESATVFGLGPIGLMVAQWLRAMGVGPILLFDIQPEKLNLAAQLGFANVFDSSKVAPQSLIEQHTNQFGVHLAIEAAGVPSSLLASLEAVRRMGRVVVLGNPAADVTLPASLLSRLMRREIEILGTWNSDFSVSSDDDDWRTTLAAIADGRLDLTPLITHQVPLSAGIEALQMMRDRTAAFCKVLIKCDE